MMRSSQTYSRKKNKTMPGGRSAGRRRRCLKAACWRTMARCGSACWWSYRADHHHGVLPRRHPSGVWRRTFTARHGRKLPLDLSARAMGAWPRLAPPACALRESGRSHPSAAAHVARTAERAWLPVRTDLGRTWAQGGRYFIYRPPLGSDPAGAVGNTAAAPPRRGLHRPPPALLAPE